MSIQDELHAELTSAMKARDRRRIDVIRQIETEAAGVRTAPGFTGEVDDAFYLGVIESFAKRMGKAREEYLALGDRGAAHAEKLGFELDYLARWLPEKAGEDETRALVDAAIVELGAGDPKMAGRVIGHVMKSHADLDGGLVARLVREALGA